MFVGQMVWKSTVLIEKNKKHFKVVSLGDYNCYDKPCSLKLV